MLEAKSQSIQMVYSILFKEYGVQGWWPLIDLRHKNKEVEEVYGHYHPSDYSFPKTKKQIYEICLGSILTQSIGWKNVEKSLLNLKNIWAIDPKVLLSLNDSKLKIAIKPAGYYNEKAKKLKEFTKFFTSLENKNPARNDLLGIWGIGRETADSMLLYAFKVPTFVVDAYTKRLFARLGLLYEDLDYDEIKGFFEKSLDKDLALYQEYHALIVEHAKNFCKKKPLCSACILRDKCQYCSGM